MSVVEVTRVHIPGWSTLGFGYGLAEDGTPVVIVGDHGAMRGIGMAIEDGGDAVMVEDPPVIAVGPAAEDMVSKW